MSIVASYFTLVSRPYFQWQDSGDVVAWTDGSTIAFRPELLEIYRRLQLFSLPPFGSVLLLLAACRDGWHDAPSKREQLARIITAGGQVDRLELLNRVFAGLDRVRALPEQLRVSPAAKAELAAMVFEGDIAPPSPGAYESLIRGLEQGLDDFADAKLQKVDVDGRLVRDLAWLDRGLGRVDAGALAARLKTGIEQKIVPVALEVPTLRSAKSLITELQDDPELGGVARLAKLLSATVNLPRPLSLPEELPLGGVSDISNRGTLDRLLLSELANDDQTLSIRVAMNEALYFRREVPPRPPIRRRVILLDSGLRMWGVPRLFAASVGLALAAGAEFGSCDGTETTVLRAAGGKTEDVDIATAAGLAEHLAVLDVRVHPGESLAPLRKLVDEAAGAIDVVVVTATDVVADPNFRRALADAQFDDIHLAVVDRSGAFELHLQTLRGRKLLKQAEFKLEEIFAPPKSAAKPAEGLVDDSRRDLPAIFRVSPFPLRLSCHVGDDRSWSIQDHGVFTYTRDGRLLHWTNSKLGARQIAEGLPEGDLHWCATRLSKDGPGLVAVIGKLSRRGLRALHLEPDHDGGWKCRTVALESQLDQPKQIFVHQATVFAADPHHLNALDASTGALLATRFLAGVTHVRSRFYLFRKANFVQWQAVAFDGTSIVFVTLLAEKSGQSRVATLFESDDVEGPRAVLHNGDILNPATGEEQKVRHDLPGNIEVAGISRNGALLLLKHPRSSEVCLVDTRTAATKTSFQAAPLTLEPDVSAVRPVTLRNRFAGIGVDATGRLVLFRRQGTHFPLEPDKTTGAIGLAKSSVKTALRVQYRFDDFDVPGVPHVLLLAQFADGSRAVLDRRGLLHLRSSDETLPEMTIVLSERGACWFPHGGLACGDEYHFDEASLLAGAGKARRVLERFVERLR